MKQSRKKLFAYQQYCKKKIKQFPTEKKEFPALFFIEKKMNLFNTVYFIEWDYDEQDL